MTATIETRTLPVLVCTGLPFERGRAQGEAFRGPIGAVIQRWEGAIERRHGISAGNYITDFLGKTNFIPAIEQWTPGLLEEVRGIAESANQPFETILAYNLMDEEWTYGSEKVGEAPACTVACLIPSGGAPIVAQTMDIPPIHDGTQVAVHHKPDDGPEQLIFTGMGMIALNGANSAGLGVVVNNLSVLPSSRSGLPVMFLIRGILERSSLPDAVAFVESAPHAIGQHYGIGSPTGIAGLEGAASGVVRADVSSGRYVHANHPLVNNEISGEASEAFARSSTFARHNRAVELIADASDQTGIERVLMDDTVPISCSPRGGFMTFGGTSIACSVPPVMHVSPGPPHETPWVALSF